MTTKLWAMGAHFSQRQAVRPFKAEGPSIGPSGPHGVLIFTHPQQNLQCLSKPCSRSPYLLLEVQIKAQRPETLHAQT